MRNSALLLTILLLFSYSQSTLAQECSNVFYKQKVRTGEEVIKTHPHKLAAADGADISITYLFNKSGLTMIVSSQKGLPVQRGDQITFMTTDGLTKNFEFDEKMFTSKYQSSFIYVNEYNIGFTDLEWFSKTRVQSVMISRLNGDEKVYMSSATKVSKLNAISACLLKEVGANVVQENINPLNQGSNEMSLDAGLKAEYAELVEARAKASALKKKMEAEVIDARKKAEAAKKKIWDEVAVSKKAADKKMGEIASDTESYITKALNAKMKVDTDLESRKESVGIEIGKINQKLKESEEALMLAEHQATKAQEQASTATTTSDDIKLKAETAIEEARTQVDKAREDMKAEIAGFQEKTKTAKDELAKEIENTMQQSEKIKEEQATEITSILEKTKTEKEKAAEEISKALSESATVREKSASEIAIQQKETS